MKAVIVTEWVKEKGMRHFILTYPQSVMINANTIQDVVKDTLNNDNEEPKVEIQQFKALK